jgi:hypothetical protein
MRRDYLIVALGLALAFLWQRNRANVVRLRPPYVREG